MSYTLTFSQLLGEFVTDKELLGAQDPYVIFEAGGKKCHTKAIKNAGAGTVEWKETYTLHEFAPKTSSILEVTVYNHNTLRPDGTLGSGTVNLSNLGESQLSGSGDRVNVTLTDKKGKNVGSLRFIVHGGGFSGTGSGSRSGTTGSGYGTETGTGSGYGTGTGTGAGIGHTGTGHHHTGSGHTGTGSGTGTGQVTGVGAGSNYGTAKAAADKAAHENRDVTIQGASGTAAGRPTGTHTGTGTGTTTGTTTGTGVRGTTGTNVQPGEVIDRKYYTGFEDRPQEQALVEQYREHNPYAKQYETTVQHTGRERLVGSSIEALGTTERVVGSDHHVHAHPHDHIARALPKGAIAERPGGEGWVQGKAGPVCDSSTFEVTGDRTVDKERTTNLREHREFEKEFEVKTALTGERALERGANTEQLHRERVLLDEKNKIACEGHPTVDATTGGQAARGPTVTGSGTGTGAHIPGTGHHTGSGTGSGAHIPGTGHHTGSGTGAHIPGTGSGTGSGAHIPGTGHHTGSGTGSGTHIPGTGHHTSSGTTGSGYGTGTGTTGSGYGTGTGATGTGSGYGTGSGTTGSGYGTGSGTGAGTGTTGSGYGTGTGTSGQSATQGMSTTQKLAALVPGTEANKEKKAAQGSSTY